ncbi:cation:proton antiporter [Rhizobium sp. Root274]|jgi:multicomponent K+:H+ antiporter subunit F|uniref:K+/H+ antiporter subunit F n=1 Tax=unclassified Rhizobium TaxID=2613769 RepID=UPI0007143395|nr:MULTISPECIES: K+/H+ antiporter subunit F [unclassified Rhizobium]KQW30424.1 cation:proton antiporter [Rhizobium sp. Root1240]KRD25275.1 cation:proton antiporter [Rhizobium sp. Root274]MBC2775007.1 K+/H+ antiporter subunit F [Rhizobium sp. AQ_MP]
MSVIILYTTVSIAKVLLALALMIAVLRIFIGPRAQDRIVALDASYIIAMLLLVTFGIGSGRSVYFEAALVIGLLGFVSTVALAKFLMRGEVIE